MNKLLYIYEHPDKKAGLLPKIFLVAIVLFVLPLDIPFFKRLFELNLLSFHYQDWLYLVSYRPRLFNAPAFGWLSYANWLVLIAVAVVIAVAFKNKKWLHLSNGSIAQLTDLLIRYRLALIVITFGLLKLDHSQLPEPTLSDLNTPYGSFLPWRLYYLSTGYAGAGYVPVLGVVEILIGLLLFTKRWYGLGALFAVIYFTNVVFANFAYSIGDHVFSSYVLLLSFVLLARFIVQYYQLFFTSKLIKPLPVVHYLANTWLYKNKKYLRSLATIYLTSISLLLFANTSKENTPYGSNRTYEKLEGFYNVEFFVKNGDTIPYSTTNASRWQNVVIEKWNTLSIKQAAAPPVNFGRPALYYQAENEKNYEALGNTARHFYHFNLDSSSSQISLSAVLDPRIQAGFSFNKKDKSTIELSGNYEGAATYIVLKKIDKKYLLQEGRRTPNKKI